MLRNVRIMTINPSTSTLSTVGETATVRMMSAATRNSKPSRMPRPISWRNARYDRSVPQRLGAAYRPTAIAKTEHDRRHAHRVDGQAYRFDNFFERCHTEPAGWSCGTTKLLHPGSYTYSHQRTASSVVQSNRCF